MELAKLVAALSIALFVSFFIVEVLSLAYKSPDVSYGSCNGGTLCASIIEKQCGKSPKGYDFSSEYSSCQSKVYSSEEYDSCNRDAQKTESSCMKNLGSQLQNYQVISFVLYGLAGILLILVGFLMLGYRSIGSGLLSGGVFVILFSGYISLFSALTSFGSNLMRITGENSGLSPEMFQVMRVILYFVVSTLLIFMTYIRLDKPGLKSDED